MGARSADEEPHRAEDECTSAPRRRSRHAPCGAMKMSVTSPEKVRTSRAGR